MRISFVADTLFVEHSEEVAYFSLMDGEGEEPENILVFSCTLPSTGELERIHLEYNDQSYGGYGCIASCHLTAEHLAISLSDQLGELEDVDGFAVTLALPEESWAELSSSLRLIFATNPAFQAEA
jgi:hypothetical protein